MGTCLPDLSCFAPNIHVYICIEQGNGVMWQVTNALNEAESARHEVPYAFIQHLLQAPAALEALHSSLNSVSGTLPCSRRDSALRESTCFLTQI